MNPRTLISLACVMVCLLACDLPGIIHEITRSDAQTPVSQPPAQTANGTGLGPQTPAGQPPTLTASGTGLAPQTPAGQPPAQTANDKGLGPRTLDVTDPALTKQYSSSVSSHQQNIFESVDKSGAPYKTIFDVIQMEQVVPQWGSYHYVATYWNGKIDPAKVTDNGVTNGKYYSVNSTGKCSVSPQTKPLSPSGSFLINLQYIKGTMSRVEDGVVINGVLTDRYELKRANVADFVEALEFKPSSLYRAREGGYLVRLEYSVVDKYKTSQTFEKEFDPSKTVLITNRTDLTY